VTIRRAAPDDAGAVAAISTASRHAAMPTISWAHSAEEDRWWVENVLLPGDEVWLLEEEGTVLGFLALHHDADGDWVSQLYLAPGQWRRGLGSALLAHAKTLRPGGLRLWCFQVNARARAFYERHGFTVARMTDGAGNEEREPDILYVWQPDRGAQP
jgi:GNAT superfamily N-acetyltransferase